MKRSTAGGASDAPGEATRSTAARHGAMQLASRGFGRATRVTPYLRRDLAVSSTPPQLRPGRKGEEGRKPTRAVEIHVGDFRFFHHTFRDRWDGLGLDISRYPALCTTSTRHQHQYAPEPASAQASSAPRTARS